MAVLAGIADAVYHIFMGVIYGLALFAIFYPFWST